MGETSETRYNPRACCQRGHARSNAIILFAVRLWEYLPRARPDPTRRGAAPCAAVLSYFALVFPSRDQSGCEAALSRTEAPVIIICSMRYDMLVIQRNSFFVLPLSLPSSPLFLSLSPSRADRSIGFGITNRDAESTGARDRASFVNRILFESLFSDEPAKSRDDRPTNDWRTCSFYISNDVKD